MSDVLPGTTGQLASADRCGEGLKHVTGAAQRVRATLFTCFGVCFQATTALHVTDRERPSTDGRLTILWRATCASGTLGGAAPLPGAVHNFDRTVRRRARAASPQVHTGGADRCGGRG